MVGVIGRNRSDGGAAMSDAGELDVEKLRVVLAEHRSWLDRDPNRKGRRADLSFRNLAEINLGRVRLARAKLAGANLRKARLAGSDLSEIDLFNADLSEADLTDARLVSADLRGSRIDGACLTGADLQGADLRRGIIVTDCAQAGAGNPDGRTTLVQANLRRAILIESRLSETDLTGCELNGADLSGADLSGAVLISANLNDAVTNRCNLEGALLCGATIDDYLRFQLERKGVDVDGSGLRQLGDKVVGEMLQRHGVWVETLGRDGVRLELERVDLRGHAFAGTPLSGAILRCSNLRGADLSGCRLVMADLSFCDLREVNLAGADLSGCALRGANLGDAVLCGARTQAVDLLGDGSRWWPTNLDRARLTNADLRDTSLAQVILRGADFTAAKVNMTTIRDGDFSEAIGLARPPPPQPPPHHRKTGGPGPAAPGRGLLGGRPPRRTDVPTPSQIPPKRPPPSPPPPPGLPLKSADILHQLALEVGLRRRHHRLQEPLIRDFLDYAIAGELDLPFAVQGQEESEIEFLAGDQPTVVTGDPEAAQAQVGNLVALAVNLHRRGADASAARPRAGVLDGAGRLLAEDTLEYRH